MPAKKGVIDLREKDLSRVIVSLSGEWEFYWQELFKYHRENPGNLNFEKIPNSWNSYGHHSQGYGTYRVQLLFPETGSERNYALYLNRVGSAYQLFINGVLRGGNGKVGKNADSETPHRETKKYYFDIESGDSVVLVIQVSNHYHATAGLKTGILLAESPKLNELALRFFGSDFFAAVLLLSLSIIYSFAYVFRPDKNFFQFSVFLLLICGYVVGTGENILMTFFPAIPYVFFMKFIHVCMALHIVVFNTILVNNFYPRNRLVVYKFINVVSVLYAVVVVFFSVETFAVALPIFHIVLLITDAYWLYLLLRLVSKNKDALIIFGGVCLYSVTVVFEITYVNQFTHNPRILPIGFLYLTFSYILVTVKAFANSYHLVEKAENEKLIALEVADQHKARNRILTRTLTKSESITAIERLRRSLPDIAFIVSGPSGCSVYDDRGTYLYDVDLTLRKIDDIFSPGDLLVRSAKGYVVNPSKIQKIVKAGRKFELVFVNPDIKGIPVGSRYFDNLQQYLAKN